MHPGHLLAVGAGATEAYSAAGPYGAVPDKQPAIYIVHDRGACGHKQPTSLLG